MIDLEALSTALETHSTVVRVVLAEVRGSTPRSAGTEMLVWEGGALGTIGGALGTIGGGRLEWEAEAAARAMLDAREPSARVVTFALGPALNQCCGGAVTAVLERWDSARYRALRCDFAGIYARPVSADAGEMPGTLRRKCASWEHRYTPMPTMLQGGWLAEPIWRNTRSVFIYGAGHVGRALALVLHPMPGFAVCVSDVRAHELAKLPEHINTSDILPTDLVTTAPDDAAHLIMTPEHDYDLTLCHAILGRRFAFVGLIGSETKWARFRSRLAALGHDDAAISRITCPIGDPALGKHPQAIAVGVAAQLLRFKASQQAIGDETI